ncbi:L-threonine-O-3-phosphate decarboxylase, partial [mine drainage metagenome]
MLEHGGNLTLAVQRFGRPAGRWLDLSTGINPHAWPIPSIPAELWHCLPNMDDDLKKVACHYFGFPQVLPVAGTQAALQMLPTLRPYSRVAIHAP